MPSFVPLAPTQASDTSSHSSNSNTNARKRSSLSRKRTGKSSALERAADSARRARIKTKVEVARSKSKPSSNIIVSGLKFIFDKVVPFKIFGTASTSDYVQPTETSSSLSQSSSPMSLSSQSTLSSNGHHQGTGLAVTMELADINITGAAAQGDSSDSDDFSHSSMEIIDSGSDEENPAFSPLMGHFSPEKVRAMLDIEEATLATAKTRAQKAEAERVERIKIYEKEKVLYGEEYAFKMQCQRELAVRRQESLKTQVEAFEDERELEERTVLLVDGQEAAVRKFVKQRDEAARSSREEWLSNIRPFYEEKKSEHKYTRDVTTKSRKNHVRFHPYVGSRRPLHPKICRYFNPSDVSGEHPFDEYTAPAPFESGITLFDRYNDRWEQLTDPNNTDPLSYWSVPWPLRSAPRRPTEIAAQEVWDFVLMGNFRGIGVTPDQCYSVAEEELERWSPYNVQKWILQRIDDEEQREDASIAADNIREALDILSSCRE